MNIGVLALQGAFAEHEDVLKQMHIEYREIRQKKDLSGKIDGLILPGGESTVMRKLLLDLELFFPLKEQIAGGLPVLGTCAGLILLAKEVEGGVPCFGTMDIEVKRNAYGRQLGSFYTRQPLAGWGEIPMTFIRAPYICAVRPGVDVLARVDGKIVAARQGRQLVTSFHPELDGNLSVHQYFLAMCRAA